MDATSPRPVHDGTEDPGVLRRKRRARLARLVIGAGALSWLILRTGAKPSRATYPCQQAAFSTASLAFGAPVIMALVALRRRLSGRVVAPLLLTVAAAGVGLALFTWGHLSRADYSLAPDLAPLADYRAQVFHKTACAQDPVGDRFPCLDDLIEMLGGQGLKFYKSTTASLVAGPAGVLAANDVVVIKINYQWPQRGGRTPTCCGA